MGLFWSQVWTLVWKNWMLKKREWKVAIWEIGFPLYFISLLMFVSLVAPPGITEHPEISSYPDVPFIPFTAICHPNTTELPDIDEFYSKSSNEMMMNGFRFSNGLFEDLEEALTLSRSLKESQRDMLLPFRERWTASDRAFSWSQPIIWEWLDDHSVKDIITDYLMSYQMTLQKQQQQQQQPTTNKQQSSLTTSSSSTSSSSSSSSSSPSTLPSTWRQLSQEDESTCYDVVYAPTTPSVDALITELESLPGLNITDVIGFEDGDALLQGVFESNATIWGAFLVSSDTDEPTVGPNAAFTLRYTSIPGDLTIPGFGPWSETSVLHSYAASLQVATLNNALTAAAEEPWTINLSLRPFPLPYYEDLDDQISEILPIYFSYIFSYSLQILLVGLVTEKQLKLKEGMKVMGLTDLAFWVSWLFTTLASTSLAAIGIVVLTVWGGIFELTSPSVLASFLILYAATTILFGFLLSTIFDDPKTAASVGWLFITAQMLVYILADRVLFVEQVTMPEELTGLLFTVPVGLGLRAMTSGEATGMGTTWANLDNTAHAAWSVARSFKWLLIDFVLYAALFFYINNARAGDHGAGAGKLFFLNPKWWRSAFRSTFPHLYVDAENSPSKSLLAGRSPRPGGSSAVVIKDLTKSWKKDDVAVDGLSLDIQMGEIFALLGHNGAGKTTTLGMLSGMVAPTSGDATILGHSIVDELSSVRTMLGVCPQHDIVWPKLTGPEHLYVYGRIKGMSESEAEAEAKVWLEKVGLGDETDKLVEGYSGGMKRKLSVAISLIGGSRVIFLDECTAGMDPYSRHKVWELLQELKSERVIIMTTHFMEEADVLGDRICIMTKGKITACGTTTYLKNTFGSGYHLVLTRDDSATTIDESGLQALVKKHVPEAAFPDFGLGDSGREVSVTLPLDGVVAFPKLLRALDSDKASLGISDYSLQMTTLEAVFLKLAAQAEAEKKAEEV